MFGRKRNAAMALAIPVIVGACQPAVEPPTGAEQVYRDTCLLCHAASGPGASAPDLTTLSAVNGGSFPMAEVIAIIDGRAGVRAHGSPMPVWGARHSDAEIEALADYLATIQQ
ncbi:cytochrome c [Nioella sp. MMSF_3534]|uniref:c-type cytochrome n=1 Tax=Nioella sp. MMSF_3534 TaxID=3046720 RepID=UPI00273EE2F4|nr:cytochrome c [Nioella sp. MMSF_3534]